MGALAATATGRLSIPTGEHDTVPETSVLLTRTSIAPPEAFTLREGDILGVEVEEIGRLENPVTVV